MFKNPFKKTADKTPLEVVLEIHHKMDSASEESVKFADNVLKNIDISNMEKYEKLSKIGFSNVEEVKKNSKKMEEAKFEREKQKIILSYQHLYPYKFILTEDVLKICEEYKLVIGPEKYYSGSVPARCLDQILDFKLRPEHVTYHKGIAKITKPVI